MDKILFFDGICVMCNSLVSFVLRHDKKSIFKFATLQGQTADELIPHLNKSLKTVVLLDEKGAHTESDAILRLFYGLGGFFKLIFLLKIFPKFIRDRVYHYISNNRYRLFGTTESCALLTAEQRRRILP